MTIIGLLLLLAVLGVVGFLLTRVPMVPWMKNLIIGVIILIAVLIVLQAFGLLNILNQPVPRP